MTVNMMGAAAADNADRVPEMGAPRRIRIIETWSGRLGLAGLGFVLVVAIFGRLVAPHGPAELITTPYSHPSARLLLGTDELGRDVLSRVLSGGLRLILLSFGATLVAYLLGVTLGLLSAYLRGIWDGVIMRALDVLLAFPPILLVLVLASGHGQGLDTIFIGAVLVNIPGSARVVRSAGLEVVTMPFVEAARLRGESVVSVLRREILANIRGAVIADAGPRLSGTIILIAGLNYLGIGVNPPTPDWGAMIYENLGGLTIQPWAVIIPALLIVLVVVSANLLGEAYLYSRDTSRSKESA
jgi:ABC-type dipeptide/oligopeptide/nickel transport system permease subunit